MRRSARTPRTSRSLVAAACLLAAGTLGTFASTAHAQVGTAITYQGLLERNGVKVATATDMRFTLFDAATAGNAVGNVVTLNAQQVSNGLFNVALDFGVNPYTADAARWMQIEVRNPAGSGNFSPMGGRQKLTASPFSLATRGIKVEADGTVRTGANFSIPAGTLIGTHNNVNTNGGRLHIQSGNDGTFDGLYLNPFPNGGNVYLGNGGGAANLICYDKVGIGVNPPVFPLEVSGRVKVRAGASGSGGIWYTDDDAPATEKSFVGRGSPTERWTGVYTGTPGNNWPLVVKDNGDVGIGRNSDGTRGFIVANNGQVSIGLGPYSPGAALNITQTASFPVSLTTNGLVSIGPNAGNRGQLEVAGGIVSGPGCCAGYFMNSGGTGPAGPFAHPLSIYATNVIAADLYIAFSDARTKNIQGVSEGARDLATIQGIEITDYTFKDSVIKGTRPSKKVIAQQVEKVYPQAVSKSTDVVPDIYKMAATTDGWVTLATDLMVGEKVRLIGEKQEGIHEVLEVRADGGAFRTAFSPSTDKVFVYGRQVNDFLSVDYEAIAMLNVSATQELARQNQAMRKQIEALEAQVKSLSSDKNAALSARLENLEALLAAQPPQAANAGHGK